MASTSSPIEHNLASNSNHIKTTKTPHLTLLSHNYASTAMLYMCKDWSKNMALLIFGSGWFLHGPWLVLLELDDTLSI